MFVNFDPVFCISARNAGFWRKNLSQKGFEKKLKIGGVLDFTAEFGLKVSQVTAGFGYGEGYYADRGIVF